MKQKNEKETKQERKKEKKSRMKCEAADCSTFVFFPLFKIPELLANTLYLSPKFQMATYGLHKSDWKV